MHYKYKAYNLLQHYRFSAITFSGRTGQEMLLLSLVGYVVQCFREGSAYSTSSHSADMIPDAQPPAKKKRETFP